MQHLDGELIIDRSSLEIRATHMSLGGAEWRRVQATIPNLDEPVLGVEGEGSGPLGEMLAFVNQSPVGASIGQVLAQATATGPADLKLDLTIPLEHTDTTRVKGSVTLAGNTLHLASDTPLLAEARGRVDFSDHGVNVVGASAKALGGDVRFDGGTQADGAMRFSGRGTVTAEALRRAGDLGELARAAELVTGQAAYRMSLGFVKGRPEIAITSDLVGLAINLPAPLGKAGDVPLPLRFETTLAPESLVAGQSPRDSVRFELGPLVQALYQRDLSGTTPKVVRGGVGVMDATPMPASGVAANINLATLDVDAWQKIFDRIAGGADSRLASGYGPDTLALRVQRLNAGTRRLDGLVAGVSQSAGLWRANVDAEQLDGYVEYRPARSGVSAGGVYARLARLALPKSDTDSVESLLDEAPSSIPRARHRRRRSEPARQAARAPDARSGETASSGKGAMRFANGACRASSSACPRPSSAPPAPGGAAAAASPVSRRRSVMDFTLAVSDSGALLTRLGTPQAVRGGKGKLAGQVSWQGSPWSIGYPSLAGKINVAIDAGQFLKADPGAARLLGVLSLQSLPRRLTLDFRDLFQQGFAFDNLSGDVTIAEGEARTNNLRMRGPQAVVLMDGGADIDRETQDLRVWVVPDVNAGAASLAYAVINPAIGLGTFLAQVVLKKQLAQAGTREFRVHGSWADPKVDTVDRKFGDDVPRLDTPAEAASASSPVLR